MSPMKQVSLVTGCHVKGCLCDVTLNIHDHTEHKP